MSLNEFFNQNYGRVFRYWKYKRPNIPYYDNENSPYECEECDYGELVDVIVLPNNDVMLAFKTEMSDGKAYINYVKLSEIDMAYSDRDQEDDDE